MTTTRLCPGCSVGISPAKALCFDCERKLPADEARRTQLYYGWNRRYHGAVTAVRLECARQFEKAVTQIRNGVTA